MSPSGLANALDMGLMRKQESKKDSDVEKREPLYTVVGNVN
jgi:hypothetical protein